MSRAISEGHRNQLAAARRQRDAAYHRERRRLQRESVGTQEQLVGPDDVQGRLDQLLESDDRHDRSDQVDDFDTDNPTQHDYTRDQAARDDDDYAHDLLDQLLLTGDDELSDIVARVRPVPGGLSFSDEENDEGSEDNPFEYEEPDEESEESEGAQDDGDGDNSVDEYHASDFSSSSDSDEDYAP
ncbi:hypothetical protein PInf_019995 [Phytophthora infestans]|nr:hypothetical protein PInf_019995 [Phytophthora infestans]